PLRSLAACGALLLATAAIAGSPGRASTPDDAGLHRDDRPMSSTVIGPLNPLLTRGAAALAAGHADEGIRLTLEGLKAPGDVHDTAAAHANLCAGYVLLRRYDDALTECNTSISLDGANWRAYNNRAAAFAAQGLYERALEDIAAGLRLAPGSPVLQRSLAIVHRNEDLVRRRGVRPDA
ncbi:MAG: tetratricopeptide repeat protein, partial [Steroidobacteraceae bacterium]